MRDERPRQKLRKAVSKGMHKTFNSGAWTALSFAGAGFLGLGLLLEFRSGPILAGLAALCTYGFLAYVLPARARARDGALNPDLKGDLGPPSDDPRVELLVEAHQHIESLSIAKSQLPLNVADMVNRLEEDAKAITNAVTEQPEKLNAVLRFFTYYLPATADLVEDRLRLGPLAGADRLSEIDQTLVRLTEAFSGFRRAVLEPDLASVDLDISLLDDALDADLEDLKTR